MIHNLFNTEKIHFITLISFIQKPLKKGDSDSGKNGQFRLLKIEIFYTTQCALILNSLCIVAGYCTEYNIGENMIRQSANTYCQQFKKNPCPIFYRSTEAYKCKCLICYEKNI